MSYHVAPNACLPALCQAAAVAVSPEALHFYGAPLQPGGRRFCGATAPEARLPHNNELCASKCPVCQQLSPIPRITDLYRSTLESRKATWKHGRSCIGARFSDLHHDLYM